MEFGGPVGSVIIIIWSHCLMLYLWISLEYYQGGLYIPDIHALGQQLSRAIPTIPTVCMYWGFMLLQIVLAYVMPGPVIKGLPVPSENGKQYSYLCNALYSWYFTLMLVGGLHYSGVFSITFLV